MSDIKNKQLSHLLIKKTILLLQTDSKKLI